VPDDVVPGSGVGAPLLRRVLASLPEARRLVPRVRMIVVAGPRIDPATLAAADGAEVRPYVHDLHLHLAARDLAIVHRLHESAAVNLFHSTVRTRLGRAFPRR
jgi:hypothetical protein